MAMEVSAEVVSDPSGSPSSNATFTPVTAHSSLSLPVVTMSNPQSSALPPGVLQYTPPPIQADKTSSIDHAPRYLSMLPSEVLNAVFEYLKTSGQIRSLTRVQQTSRLYYKMIRPIVWTEVHMSLFALNECWLSFNRRRNDHHPPPTYSRPTWTDHGKESLLALSPDQADEAHHLFMEGRDEAWHRLSGEVRLRYDLSHVKALVVVPMPRANALQYLTAVDIKAHRQLPRWLRRLCKRDMMSDTKLLGIDEIRATHVQSDLDQTVNGQEVTISTQRNVKPLLSTLAGEVRFCDLHDTRWRFSAQFSRLSIIHMHPGATYQTCLDYLDGPLLPPAYGGPIIDPCQYYLRANYVLDPVENVLTVATKECALHISVVKSAGMAYGDQLVWMRAVMMRYYTLLHLSCHRHITIPSSQLENVSVGHEEGVAHTSVDILNEDKADRQTFVAELVAFFRRRIVSIISGCKRRTWRSLSIRVIDETTALGHRGSNYGYKPSGLETQLEVRLHRMVDIRAQRAFAQMEKEAGRKKRPIGISEIEFINLVRSRIQLDLGRVADIDDIMINASLSGDIYDDSTDCFNDEDSEDDSSESSSDQS
jgi:hypothetical protein